MEFCFNFFVNSNHSHNSNMVKDKYAKALVYDKLVFYSVISNYRTLSKLGLIKKTGTGLGRGLLMGGEELMNVLGVGALLLG